MSRFSWSPPVFGFDHLMKNALSSSLNEISCINISFTQTIHIVCWQRDLYFIVDIEPFWMMVNLIGIQCDAGHKSKSLQIQRNSNDNWIEEEKKIARNSTNLIEIFE